ncbi:hypothetical protein GIB67_011524 [Kingdonia uniflora]|uniref:Uncharacterized protein n=1 Tax=Kingdonia uniflora TaxID=39325 RepID=A0A7J7NLR8_9MAGN|nr:hypothetical protein GIB67_011524 [Kingdonia uniflora]
MDSNTTTGNDTLASVGRASLPDGRKRNVSVNHLGKANGIDEDTIAFATNIGVLARKDIPTIYDDIRLVSAYFTNRVLEKLEEGYEMSLVSDDYLKKKIASSWRLNKSRLQTKYITGHDSADVKAHPTPLARNKVNRSKLKAPICIGRRSLPVLRHMLAMKRKLNSNALVVRSELYLAAHTKRDNTVQYLELAEKIMAIESQKDRGVARGEVVAVDPDNFIHNVLLGDGFYKILLSKVIKPRTPLSKDDGYSEDLGDDGEGAYVAWAIWCLEKLVMLYLKEEDEKKIGDFERQVSNYMPSIRDLSNIFTYMPSMFSPNAFYNRGSLERKPISNLGQQVHTVDMVNQIMDLDEDGWEFKNASEEEVEVSSIKAVETTTTTITSDYMIQDYVKLEKQKGPLPLSIFNDRELYSDDSIYGDYLLPCKAAANSVRNGINN